MAEHGHSTVKKSGQHTVLPSYITALVDHGGTLALSSSSRGLPPRLQQPKPQQRLLPWAPPSCWNLQISSPHPRGPQPKDPQSSSLMHTCVVHSGEENLTAKLVAIRTRVAHLLTRQDPIIGREALVPVPAGFLNLFPCTLVNHEKAAAAGHPLLPSRAREWYIISR